MLEVLVPDFSTSYSAHSIINKVLWLYAVSNYLRIMWTKENVSTESLMHSVHEHLDWGELRKTIIVIVIADVYIYPKAKAANGFAMLVFWISWGCCNG